MNRIVELHDRSVIATWLKDDVAMNMFGLCDLDRSEWQRTRWLGLDGGGELRSILLVYSSPEGPLVILHGASARAIELLEMSRDVLPQKFYLSMAMPFGHELKIEDAEVRHYADYLRMVPDRRTGRKQKCEKLVPLTVRDAEKVRRLLFVDNASPDAWFTEQSLQSGLYRGWVENNELLGVVGVHAASEEFGVAIMGNLAVRPDVRGKGIARILLEDLLNELHERGWRVAFNVRPENTVALALYAGMGCQVVGTVREFGVTLHRAGRSACLS